MAAYVTELLVRLGWDGSAAKRGMAAAEVDARQRAQRIEKQLEPLSKRIGGQLLGGLGIMQGIRAFERIAEESAKISRESGKLGVTVERYQALQRVSEEFGMTVEDLNSNFAQLPQHIRDSVLEYEKFSRSEANVSALSETHRSLQASKAWLAKAAGLLAGAVNKAGVWTGREMTRRWGIFQKLRGNKNYGEELLVASFADPADAERINRLEGALAAKQAASKDGVVGPFSTWLDYERGLRGIKREEAIKKAIEARGNLNITSDSLAKIGGFNVGSDRQGAMNIVRQQIQLLERIARAFEAEE